MKLTFGLVFAIYAAAFTYFAISEVDCYSWDEFGPTSGKC